MASRLAVSLLLIAPLVGVRMLAAQHTGAPPGGQHQGGQHQGDTHVHGGQQPVRRTAADTAAACRRPGAEQQVVCRGWLDTAFAGMQQRGQQVMGVDQYTSSHRFDDLPDGGRIELQRDGADPAGAAAIRRHFAEIAGKFADADFDAPGLVHAQDVPGTRVMAAKRSLITYTVEVLPRGAALRIASRDSEAVAAIHQFLQFQRREHGTGQRP
ncbi:MAG: hypothetical protein Q8Q85_15760 [Gemmatimonadales bacterium]|nr:hypothetical protein [Gemmatimonadales bacterium]